MPAVEPYRLLFTLVVRAAKADSSDDWLLPAHVLAWSGDVDDSPARFRLDTEGVIELAAPGVDAAQRLARTLRRELGVGGRATENDVLKEVLVSAARVRLKRAESLDAELSSLRGRLAQILGEAVVVFGVAALRSLTSEVLPLGRSVMFGHMSDAFVDAVDELATQTAGRSLTISADVDAFWVEDYVAGREDPQVGEERAAERDFAMPALAIAVDAVGATARQRALEVAESVLGAVWVLDDEEGWRSWPPWVLGTPTVAEDPRAADMEADPAGGLLPLQVLQVDTTPLIDLGDMEWRAKNYDIDDALAGAGRALLRDVADAHRGAAGAYAARLAAACRLALYGARATDPHIAALHATIALESLVGNEERSGSVTANFVRRLSALLGRLVDGDTLKDIYDMRSDVAHTGRSARSFQEAAGTASEALLLCRQSIRAAHRLCERQRIVSTQDVLVWLDA